MNTEQEKKYAIVELMGHVVIGGQIQEVEFAGSKMLQVTTKNGTQLVGGGSIYRITFCDELAANSVRENLPFSEYDVKAEMARRGYSIDLALPSYGDDEEPKGDNS